MKNFKKYKNTYKKLNQDLSKSKYPPDIYYDAQNIRVVADARQSSGSAHNGKGNQYEINIPDIELLSTNADGTYTYSYIDQNDVSFSYTTDKKLYSGYQFSITGLMPIGHCVIRNWIVLFTTNETGIPDPVDGSIGVIWIYDMDSKVLELTYMDMLNFSQLYPIDARGRYENTNSIKTWWADYNNELRHANLADPDLAFLPADFINIVPIANLSEPKLVTTYFNTGLLKSGKVSYAYNYANQFGSETKMSSMSPLYNVNKIDTGGLNEEQMSTAFRIRIDDVREDFDYIRIYRLYFTLPDAPPKITLIQEEPVISNYYEFTDDGTESISDISYAQFLLVGVDPFIPKTVETKDNRLFAGNIKYNFFDVDFDTKAYRFDNVTDGITGTPTATVLNNVGAEIFIHNTSIPNLPSQFVNWNDVPDNHSAINPSNKAQTNNNGVTALNAPDDQYYNEFIYQSDGTTIGAEGPNLSISLVEVETAANQNKPGEEQNKAKYPQRGNIDGSWLNPNTATSLNFKRDEIYRLGLEFFNSRGQRSFINWVCDFRFPSPHDNACFNADTKKHIQLQVTVDLKANAQLLAQEAGATHFRVVRALRDDANKSVVCSGFIGNYMEKNFGDFTGIQPHRTFPYYGAYQTVIDNTTPPDPPNPIIQVPPNARIHYQSGFTAPFTDYNANLGVAYKFWSDTITEFISPDLDTSTDLNGYFLIHTAWRYDGSMVGKNISVDEPDYFNGSTEYITKPGSTGDEEHFYYEYCSGQFGNESTEFGRVSDGIVRINPASNIILFEAKDGGDWLLTGNWGSYTITPKIVQNLWSGGDGDSWTNAHMAFVVAEDQSHVFVDQLDKEVFTYADSHNDVDRYYVLAADFKKIVSNQYGGDSFADRTRTKYIPSSPLVKINETAQAYGDTYSAMMRHQRSEIVYKNNEKTGWRDLVFIPCEMDANNELSTSVYTRTSLTKYAYLDTIEDFEEYNEIYDEQNTINPRPQKPLGYLPVTTVDNETRWSDLKQGGELFDAFTIFREGNKNEVDGTWGPIIRLITNKDQLFYFQHYGYGIWAVNPRVQVQATDSTAMEIGTGGVLHDYQYISTNVGCQHMWSISRSLFGLIFYDQHHRKLRFIGTKNEELNLKGINTFLQNLPEFNDSPYIVGGSAVITGFHQRTNETIIVFKGSEVNKTWVYSHPQDGFTNRLTMNASMFIQANSSTFTFDSNNMFAYNKGNRGRYNNILNPSTITLIINGDPDVIKILNNLEWNSEVYDSLGNEISNRTITHIRIYNDYQDTGIVALNDANSERLLRQWRFTTPILNGLERLRSQYHFVELRIDNQLNDEVIIHDLISSVILQS